MKRKGLLWVGIIVALLLAALISAWYLCAFARGSGMVLSPDPLKSKDQILKIIPLGTPVATAEDKMRGMGFSCQDKRIQLNDARIRRMRILNQGENLNYRNGEHITFLSCTQKRTVWVLIHREWFIALVYKGNRGITNVIVKVSCKPYP